MSEKIEKEKDVVEIRNLPDFSEILGCSLEEDNFTHLGALFAGKTACGKPLSGSVIVSRSITVDCPECAAEIRYRSKHPDAAKKSFGVVTHKKEIDE